MFLKKLFVIFFVFLLLLSFMACNNKTDSFLDKQTQLNRPPSLKIFCQDKSIDAKTGTYSWYVDNNDGSEIGMEYDSVAPPELVKNSTPLTVSPKSSLTLSFSDKPEDITVNVWQDNKPVKQPLIGDKIITSESRCSIIYEVNGTWEQGTVRYAFLVNVE